MAHLAASPGRAINTHHDRLMNKLQEANPDLEKEEPTEVKVEERFYFPGEDLEEFEEDSECSLERIINNKKPRIFIKEKEPASFPEGNMKYIYIAYWSKFFDVSTTEVIRRIGGALFPFNKASIFPERYFDKKEPESKEVENHLL
jgi:hypothetical protein